MGVPGGTEIHLQLMEDPRPKQVDALQSSEKPTLVQAPGSTCGLMERGAHAGVGLLANFVSPWETYAGAGLSPVQATQAGAVLKNSVNLTSS
ncbi:hypothetical protein TURU_142887 [Turdus rufiventris]|nr:hypothetical protein TURU_142887 [Turdus rufiventris]